MHHRSQAARALLAVSAHYWRMRINARQSHPSYGQRRFAQPAAGPCKRVSPTSAKQRQG